MNQLIKKIGFFSRNDNPKAKPWEKKIRAYLNKKYPQVKVGNSRPHALLILGGDGTILEGARKFLDVSPVIFGLNLGHVGFLASVRDEKKFLAGIDKLLSGAYTVASRMMLTAKLLRDGKTIKEATAFNDIVVQNLIGLVDIEVSVEEHPLQYIRGSGALVATASGSTAYNLSSHGPIVMPDIQCMIITELMDHNIPTPSVVIKPDHNIFLKIRDFRKRDDLTLKTTGEAANVLLLVDGGVSANLEINDVVAISKNSKLIKFAEIEKHYFLKSLQEKFGFK